MTAPKPAPQVQQPTSIMFYVSGLVIAGLLVFFSLMVINSLGLREQTAMATVTGKGYRAAGKTYTTQKIGKRMMTIPRTAPEAYYLWLDIDGKKAAYVVSREMYDRIDSGDQFNARYVRKRLTRGIRVIAISY